MGYRDEEQQKQYQREWYQRNREKQLARAKRKKWLHRQIAAAFKDRPCSDCDIQYPSCVMQFDHVEGEKSFGIAAGANQGIDRFVAEIMKCEVVCANCHATRTWKRSRGSSIR